MAENKRKILLVNDDGIQSDGLCRLAAEAAKWGEVWVVAPDGQRSACSHSLTIDDPLIVRPYDFPVAGVHAFSCSGLPTDCVRIGLFGDIMPGKPDVVFSGINNGYNTGTDIQYSATVGAALDAAMCGIPAIAFSEGFQSDTRRSGFEHAVTDAYLPKVMAELLNEDLAAGQVINVNFPDCALDSCKGILRNRRVSMQNPYVDVYKKEEVLPDGGLRYSIHWVDRVYADEGTDSRAILDNYVAIGVVNNIS